jgi:predicted RNA methylase
MTNYTVPERASRIYKTALDVFNWSKSSDCVTPLEVAQNQFEGLDPDFTVFIPGAGIGTYVVAALEAGLKPENIFAIELDPAYFELGSAIYRRFGVNYVLDDLFTWQLNMQRIDAVIGNPPYSDTRNVKGATSGGCSKGLDNQFFERAIQMADRVSLIIRSKYFAKKSAIFRRKLFSSGKLAEITALSPSVFPSISLTETCIVTYDVNHVGATKVTFQNGEVREIFLTADTCIKLTNPDYQSDAPNNLAARHLMGEVGLNMMEDGDCPMILTCNGKSKQIEVRKVADHQHVCGLNEHGVVMNRVYGGKGLGRVFVKPFDHSISRSAVMLRTSSEEESETLRDYLLSEEIQNLVNKNKISNVHSKELFRTIIDPLFN